MPSHWGTPHAHWQHDYPAGNFRTWAEGHTRAPTGALTRTYVVTRLSAIYAAPEPTQLLLQPWRAGRLSCQASSFQIS